MMSHISGQINICSAFQRFLHQFFSTGSWADCHSLHVCIRLSKQLYMRKPKRLFYISTACFGTHTLRQLTNAADSICISIRIDSGHLKRCTVRQMQCMLCQLCHFCHIIIRMHGVMHHSRTCHRQYFSSIHCVLVYLTKTVQHQRMMGHKQIDPGFYAVIYYLLRRIQCHEYLFYFRFTAAHLQSRIIPVHRQRRRKLLF